MNFRMDTNQRVEIVNLIAKLESVTLVRREMQIRRLKIDVRHENMIINLSHKFKKTGYVADVLR